MVPDQDITGVVLAGGRARRMGGADKGLLVLHGRPLVRYAIDALRGVCATVMVNANRSLEEYAALGCPVVPDINGDFDGPLAGLLAAMQAAQTTLLLCVPCDSPLMTAPHLMRLVEQLRATDAEIAVAYDGERLHPVFLCLHRALGGSLAEFLATGQRKIDLWLPQHRLTTVDYSAHPELFRNINTPADLAELELGDAPTACRDTTHG